MREFNKVSPAVWQSSRFQSLGDDAKLLHVYLLSNQHQNSAGCYRLPKGYACFDMGGWPAERYDAAMASLVAGGLVQTDTGTNEVLIERWFKHNGPMNTKHMIGTDRLIDKIESVALRTAAKTALADAWAEFQAQQHKASEAAPRTSQYAHLTTPRMGRAG